MSDQGTSEPQWGLWVHPGLREYCEQHPEKGYLQNMADFWENEKPKAANPAYEDAPYEAVTMEGDEVLKMFSPELQKRMKPNSKPPTP